MNFCGNRCSSRQKVLFLCVAINSKYSATYQGRAGTQSFDLKPFKKIDVQEIQRRIGHQILFEGVHIKCSWREVLYNFRLLNNTTYIKLAILNYRAPKVNEIHTADYIYYKIQCGPMTLGDLENVAFNFLEKNWRSIPSK